MFKLMGLSILGSVIISGCQSLPTSQASRLKGNIETYLCDEQVTITTQMIDEETIRLSVANRVFELTQFNAPDKSQNYYRSEQGLEPGQGLLWVKNAQQSILKTMVLDHTVKIEDYPVIYQCQLNT